MRTVIALVVVLALCGLAAFLVLAGDDSATSIADAPVTEETSQQAAAPAEKPGEEAGQKVTRGRDDRGEEAVEDDVELLSISGVVQIDGGDSPLAGATVSAYAWEPDEDSSLMDLISDQMKDAFDEDDIEEIKEEIEVTPGTGVDEDGDGEPDSGESASVKVKIDLSGGSSAKSTKKGMDAIKKAGGLDKLLDAALGHLGSNAQDAELELAASTTSDDAGAFRIDGLKPGFYELRASAPGHVRAKARVSAGDETVKLRLPIGATLNAIVMCEGNALPDVTVFTDGAKTVTDGGGHFSFDGVRMPKAWLLLTAKGYVSMTHPVELQPGVENPEEAIVMVPAGRVAGTVRDADGKALVGVRVTAEDGVGMADMMSLAMKAMGGKDAVGAPAVPDVFADTDENGVYLLEDVKPGDRTIVANHDGFLTSSRKEVIVEKRRTTEGVDISMVPEAVLVGQVTGPDGKPLGGAEVSIKVPDDEGGMMALMAQFMGGNSESETADPDGNFRVTNLPAGDLEVTVTAVGFLKSRETVTLIAGQDTRRDFALREGYKVGGRVLTPDGTPLANADVEVEWPRQGEGSGNPMMDMMLGGESLDAETDEEGNFVVAGLQEGPYTVTADHAEYLEVKVEDVVAGTVDLDLTVGLAAVLRGVVISEVDGAAMKGVSVTAEGGKKPSSGNPIMAMLGSQGEKAQTGADGAFEMKGLYPGKYRVWGRVRGYADSDKVQLELVAGDVIEDVTVVMPPGEVLRGEVVDKGGSPVHDALVFISRSKNPWAGNMTDMALGQGSGRINAPPESIYAYSRVDGSYELTGLTPGKVTVEVRSHSHAPLTRRGIAVPGGDLDLELSSGGVVAGVVLDSEGEPQAGKQVMLMKGMGIGQRFASTDGQGRYRLENLAPGSYMMMLMDLGGGGAMGMGDMKFKNVTVRDGETTEQDFVEDKSGKPVSGVVIANGEPVANSIVIMTGEGGGGSGMKMETTGDDGRFTFKGVTPGEYTVMVQRNMMGGAATSVKVTVTEERDVPDVRLEFSSLSLEGKVVDEETGAPVGAAQLVVSDAGGRGTMTSMSEAIEKNRGQGFTGSDGTFKLEGMPDGTFSIRVTATGYAGTHLEGVRPGSPITIKMSKGLELAVTVTDTKGDAITGASIQATDAEGRESLLFDISFQGITDSEGLARLRMHPGSYTLHVQAEGYPAETVKVTASQGTVAVKLKAGGSLDLEVVDGAGQPIPGIAAVMKDKDGKVLSRLLSMGNMFGSGTTTDDKGRLSRDGLPPGTVTVTVTDPKDTSRVATGTVKISSGGTAKLKLTLQ